MSIDWNAFSPVPSLIGGTLIGLAASALALFDGRIAGISGIVGGLVPPRRGDLHWRLAFVGGLLCAPWAYQALHALPAIRIEAAPLQLAFAGLLVGVGTRLGSGCTSGHGVCGLARGSRRSLVATLSFIATGVATASLVGRFLGGQ